MNKKKVIVCCVFMALILFTIIYTAVKADETYRYEVQNYDIMEGLGAAFVVLIGEFIVFCELDLLFPVYYFLFRPKTIVKSIFCVLPNLCLALIFAYAYFSDRYAVLRKYEITPVLLFVLCVILRIVYIGIPA